MALANNGKDLLTDAFVPTVAETVQANRAPALRVVPQSSSGGTATVDTELPAARLAADSLALPTAPDVLAVAMLYDSISGTLRLARTAGNDTVAGTNILSVVPSLADGSGTFGRQGSIANTTAGATGVRSASVGPVLSNGTTFDPQRNNTEATALASAARTASVSSADIVNYNGRGIIAFLDITVASGTGGLYIQIFHKDPAGTAYFQSNVDLAPIVATGRYAWELFPGASTAPPGGIAGIVQRTAASLSRTSKIKVVHGDGSSYTYSVGYALIL